MTDYKCFCLDRCSLRKIEGPCNGYYPQWYYDKERNHCAQFIWGGCLGNNNRFETNKECEELCVRDSSFGKLVLFYIKICILEFLIILDVCEQGKVEGPCHGRYERWYFDKDVQACQPFVYGGCLANGNNFLTEAACKQKCTKPGLQKGISLFFSFLKHEVDCRFINFNS